MKEKMTDTTKPRWSPKDEACAKRLLRNLWTSCRGDGTDALYRASIDRALASLKD